MQEPMNTPLIDSPRYLTVMCPAAKVSSIEKFLQEAGCLYEEMLTPEDIFPDPTPGTILRGFRYREDLTQPEFAKLIGISRRKLSEMENNKRPIDEEMAIKFADFFHTTPDLFRQSEENREQES